MRCAVNREISVILNVMSKILLTGATGFIGSHLAETLVRRGDEVACLVRRSSRLELLKPLNVKFIYGDVTDRDSLHAAVAGQDIVYHLAGCTRAIDIKQYYRVHVLGVRNLMQVCARQTSPPVVVLVSSLAAAGPTMRGRIRTESDHPAPVSHYGRSKRLGELSAERFAGRVPVTIIRPPIVLGQRDRTGLEMFLGIDRFRVHMIPGLARHRFSLIHADDLTELLILAARRGARLCPTGTDGAASSQGYYFAACNEHPTYAELGRMIGNALGRRRVLPFHLATPLVWMVSGIVEVISRIRREPLYLNLDKTCEITAGPWVCSPQRAVDELGFSVAAPLAERLHQTAEGYRRQGWL